MDLLRRAGIEVITDSKEAQRVLDSISLPMKNLQEDMQAIQ